MNTTGRNQLPPPRTSAASAERGAQGGGTDECGPPVGEAAHHAEGDQHGGEERAVREARARRTRRPRRRRSRTRPVANGARVRSTRHRRRSAARPSASSPRPPDSASRCAVTASTKMVTTVPTAAKGSHRIGPRGHTVTVGRGWVITVTTLRPVPAPGIRPATYLAGAPPNVPIVARWQISTTPSRCGRTDPTAGWRSPTPTTSRSAACSAAGPPPSCWAPSSGPPRERPPPRRSPSTSSGRSRPVVTSPSPRTVWAAGGRSSTGGPTRGCPAATTSSPRRWSCSPTAGRPTSTASGRCPTRRSPTRSNQLEAPGPQGKQTMIRAISGEYRER